MVFQSHVLGLMLVSVKIAFNLKLRTHQKHMHLQPSACSKVCNK